MPTDNDILRLAYFNCKDVGLRLILLKIFCFNGVSGVQAHHIYHEAPSAKNALIIMVEKEKCLN